jgi:hypothetical protein
MSRFSVSGTANDCNQTGHCWHEGTATYSLWCCKCGAYLVPEAKRTYRLEPYIYWTAVPRAGREGNE